MSTTPPYGQQPGPQWGQYQPPQPMRPEDQRLWSTLVHVGGIFFQFIVPLVGYLVLRDRGPFVHAHTRAALNFHITMAIAYAVGVLTTPFGIGVLILFVVAALQIVFGIIAAVRANAGQPYKYPFTYPFVH
jgi:uncharacterized Tic20 family protein